jgi:ABC-type enterochelin transport system permease subunit
MTFDSKAAKWGYGLLGLAAAIFLSYWVILLEPVQAAFIEKGKRPGLLLFGLFGLAVGSLFGLLTILGFSLTKPQWFKISYEARLMDVFDSSATKIWVSSWAVAFLLFTLLWRGQVN